MEGIPYGLELRAVLYKGINTEEEKWVHRELSSSLNWKTFFLTSYCRYSLPPSSVGEAYGVKIQSFNFCFESL